MNRIGFVIGTISFALLSIFVLNIVFDMEYNNLGSFDVVTGAFVEVFILTVFFEYLNARDKKEMERHLQNHLQKIEELIKKKG